MARCHRCHQPLEPDQAHAWRSHWLCSDCYLDEEGPKLHSVSYRNDPANFMRRLKKTHSVIKQKID